MKVLFKITKIIFNILLLATVAGVVALLVTSRSQLFGGYQSFVVLTGSMQPTLPVGSLVFTSQQTSYKKGDIVAFKSGAVTITHRIVNESFASGFATYTTKGDANNTVDSNKVASSQILGRELYFVPEVGKAILFLQTPVGFFYGVLFPIIAFIIYEVWNLKKEIEWEAESKFRERMRVANSNPSLHANNV